jgi:predicted nucleotidyltransferase
MRTVTDAIQAQLDELIRQIVEAVHPLRIILFGSAARDHIGPDSDLDLLIVMPDGTHRRHAAQYLYRSIHGVTTPFDLVVATPSDLQKYRHNPGLIYRTILEEGRTVYAA